MQRSVSTSRVRSVQRNSEWDDRNSDPRSIQVQPITAVPRDLRARMYDKGFNIRTMPSVSRPETSQSTERPLTAKLYSLTNKLSVPVLQEQSTILSSRMRKTTEKFGRSQSTSRLPSNRLDGQRSGSLPQFQHSSLAQLNFYQQQLLPDSEVGSPLLHVRVQEEGSRRSERGRSNDEDYPRYKSAPKERPVSQLGAPDSRPTSRGGVFRATSTNSLHALNPLNKLLNVNPDNTADIQTMQRTMKVKLKRSRAPSHNQTSTANFFNSTQRATAVNLPGKLTRQEYQHSKTIINKMAGKHAVNPRYHQPASSTSNLTQRMSTSQPRVNVFNMFSSEKSEGPLQEQHTQHTDGKTSPSRAPGGYKRAPSNLDKYIELILKNVTSIDEFIYLVNKSQEDPYDLHVVDYAVLKKNNPKEYYTISMKGLCHYYNGKPTEFISLAIWLKERETYDQVKSLSFFDKFRRWKTLKMWRRNVEKYKALSSTHALQEKLFILNPILNKTLLAHRAICCELEQLRIIDVSKQVEVEKPDQFAERQERKRSEVSERIQELSSQARENIRLGFQKCLEIQRKKKGTGFSDNDFTKDGNIQSSAGRLKESAYEALGFPDNMTYERRSELRKECSMFIRFAYLLDFLALNALSNVYNNSVNELIVQLNDLNYDTRLYVHRGSAENSFAARKNEPMYYVKLRFAPESIPSSAIYEQPINKFALPPHGTSKISEFNVLSHIYLEPDFEGEAKQEEEEVDDIEIERRKTEFENRQLYAQRVTNIARFWLSVEPTLDSIFNIVLKCIAEGMNSLQAFERWSKHDEMTPYANVLEEWDDIVAEDWDAPDSNFLNPQDWIDVHKYDQYAQVIRGALSVSFDRTDDFQTTYNAFLEKYRENSLINYDVLQSEQLAGPLETVTNLIAMLIDQKEYFEKELPVQADIGLLRIDCRDARKMILPNPDNMLNDLKKRIPAMLRDRLLEISQWLSTALHEIKHAALSIDDFVKQSISLDNVNRDFPSYKSRLEIIELLYSVLIFNEFAIKKEDGQLKSED